MTKTVPPQVLAWFSAQLTQIKTEGERLEQRNREMAATIADNHKILVQLGDEYRALRELVRKYDVDPEKLLAESTPVFVPSNDNGKHGPFLAALTIVREEPGQSLGHGDLVERLSKAIEDGRVRSSTTDAKKLASSVVGILVRKGRLVRDSANMVTLQE